MHGGCVLSDHGLLSLLMTGHHYYCDYLSREYHLLYVCILNWPLPIGAFQDQYKQTMTNKYSNEHNKVKSPNWQEADQLVIYKRSREVELEATENNISQWSERDLNPRPKDFKSGALTTRPRCLVCMRSGSKHIILRQF